MRSPRRSWGGRKGQEGRAEKARLPSPLIRRRRWCWGASGGLPHSLAWADDSTLAHIAGSNVVLYQPGDGASTRSQRLLPASSEARPTALAVCPSKRVLALAERPADGGRPSITVFDLQTLKRRKVLAPPAAATDGAKVRRSRGTNAGRGEELLAPLSDAPHAPAPDLSSRSITPTPNHPSRSL